MVLIFECMHWPIIEAGKSLECCHCCLWPGWYDEALEQQQKLVTCPALHSVYCTSHFVLPTSIGQEYRRIVPKCLFFNLFQLYTNLLIYKIGLQVLFLPIDVLPSITWMQQHTENLFWLLIYSEIVVSTRRKTSITPVLFSTVQRIHASSLQSSFFPMNPWILCCIRHILQKVDSIFDENSSY